MKVLHASLADVTDIVLDVGRELYGDNLRIRTGADRTNERVKRCTFSLGVHSSVRGAPGARSSADIMLCGGGANGGMRVTVACWHAHFDVIDEIFARYPHAIVDSLKASYRADNFMAVAYTTAFEDVGARYGKSALIKDLCECGEEAWPFDGSVDDFGANCG